ncbi:UV damage endonuclease [Bacillus phage SP-15]|uniref:UV damage endonuclease n=1 Tax=Bacillus phage SP-15 TaxID=1792032 RepID=A0A127AW32_9CAUD|nr:endonuclease [Bacillus phage SP-15]AMM44906.1 UV damage endonuclease [Bacillus phage SP-15]
MISLGYACVNTSLGVSPNRKTTIARLKRTSSEEKKINILRSKMEANIKNLESILIWNAQNGIHLYRIPSEFVPLASLEWARNIWNPYETYKEEFKRLGQLANELDQRLSFHPGQFVVLSSKRDSVTHNSIAEIDYHAKVLTMMNLKYQPIINIHGGGHYGDKESALARFKENYRKLSDEAQMYLTVENDQNTYTPDELYELYYDLKIPILYDWTHHHWNRGQWDPQYALNMCIDTFVQLGWKRPPKVHISSDVPDSRRHKHDLFVKPSDFMEMYLSLEYEGLIDVMLEVKMKDKAVLRLRDQLVRISGNMDQYEEVQSSGQDHQ